jgi:hypothetical protein
MATFTPMLFVLLSMQQAYAPIDWKQVDQALGRSGSMQGDVYRVGFPRSDLRVTVGTVAVKPAFALGSWVAFQQTADSETMLMGDLVLQAGEVGPVISALQQRGIEQTALHNHLFGESPEVMYLHVSGRGRPVSLAKAVHDALVLTHTPLTAPPAAAQPELALDTAQIATILETGARGRANGGVYQVSVPRSEPVTVDGVEMSAAMGVATAINFQSTGAGRAAITGDFVMTNGEVNPVIRALRANDIQVTALHSHLLSETPHLFFMHFWAEGDALRLARGIRAALDQMNVKKEISR